MTIPSLVLGLIIALLMGALFHLWRDGGGGRLVFFLVLSSAGFAAGHWIGNWQHWMLFPVGPLNTGCGILGSLIFLIAGNWLSRIELRGSAGGDDGV